MIWRMWTGESVIPTSGRLYGREQFMNPMFVQKSFHPVQPFGLPDHPEQIPLNEPEFFAREKNRMSS